MFLPFISGCSVVNFSGNYYNLPQNYKNEITGLWLQLNSALPLKHKYTINLAAEEEIKGLKGIPALTQNNTVIMPVNFVKYVYQNYYDDRIKIFTCVIVHEMAHAEFGLPSQPPDAHFKTDFAAIKLLGDQDSNSAQYFYNSFKVLHNYWFARKGMAGHTLNVGWNVANAAALAYGGTANFKDWFATDIKIRLKLLRKNFTIDRRAAFKRSRG